MVYFDDLEVRDPGDRERALLSALAEQVAHAKARAPYFAKLLEHIDARSVTSRAALARLPVTRKSELHALQQSALPFGGLTATAPGALAKIFVSPGPIYDPEGRGKDYWRASRAMYAAGFRAGDVVHNGFSYHLSPAGSMMEGGLIALGCAVIPGGVGQTEAQAATIAQVRPVGYVGTPSFLKLILEKADELKLDVTSLCRALVSGEAFPPALREAFRARGIDAYQVYASADLGAIAYETEAREGLIVDEGVLVEIVRPGTGDPVPDGEVGEVIVTTFNRDYPLIRFATGDLSAVLAGRSPCGRTNVRIKGWMGRADQTTKVRGLFVHPHQIAEVARRFPDIQRARAVVDSVEGNDRLRLLCAVATPGAAGLRDAIEAALRDITRVRAEVEFVEPQSLPNDGKVIDDVRKIG
jgi:phenylacetate-coenzyme A ligase PaaK-like adenylate-forming protein